jgi:hypothetical protein
MKIEIHIDDRIVGAFRWAKATFTKRRAAILTGGVALCGLAAVAHAVTKPHTFSSGQPALASEVNANFDALFDAVTDVEQKLDSLSTSSAYFPANSFNTVKGAASYDGYMYLNDNETNNLSLDVFGNVAVQLPPGTVLTNLTCYYYNNSDIVGQVDGTTLISHFTTMLRRKDYTNLNDLTGDTLGRITVWPPKGDAIQEFSTDLDVEIEPGSSYYLHIDVNSGDDVPPEVYADRLLRHYGCRIDYELP